MSMNAKLWNAVRDNTPPFNDYLLRGFAERQMAELPGKVAFTFREMLRRFDTEGSSLKGRLSFVAYHQMPPEQWVAEELASPNPRMNVLPTGVSMWNYQFLLTDTDDRGYATKEVINIPVVLPYLQEGCITMYGTPYALRKSIVEHLFNPIDTSGIMTRVMRGPLKFTRIKTPVALVDYDSGETYGYPFVTAAKIHLKQTPASRYITVIHYLLCHFGWPGMIQRFGFDPADVVLSDTVDNDTSEFGYILACNPKVSDRKLFIKVRRSLLENVLVQKIIANAMHTMSAFGMASAQMMMSNTIDWRVMMGVILYPEHNQAQGLQQIMAHFTELDTYLDSLTQQKFNDAGVPVTSIYDIIVYAFENIDRFLTTVRPQDYSQKVVDVIGGMFLSTVASYIFKASYRADSASRRPDAKTIRAMLRQRGILLNPYGSPHASSSDGNYNDNLMSRYAMSILGNGTAATVSSHEQRLHSSHPSVKSLNAHAGGTPGVSGLINPFLPIAHNGAIIRQPYMEEADTLQECLPI